MEGIEYLWPKTPAGTNASIVCQNNPRFSVMRNCNASGTWQRFDLAGCGMLTSQLRETLSYLEVSSASFSLRWVSLHMLYVLFREIACYLKKISL